jgi:hypothetical protein
VTAADKVYNRQIPAAHAVNNREKRVINMAPTFRLARLKPGRNGVAVGTSFNDTDGQNFLLSATQSAIILLPHPPCQLLGRVKHLPLQEEFRCRGSAENSNKTFRWAGMLQDSQGFAHSFPIVRQEPGPAAENRPRRNPADWHDDWLAIVNKVY